MKSEDLMSKDNNRQDAIDKLISFCLENNLDYSYTDKIFAIKLPGSEPLPSTTTLPSKRRQKFDISDWGPRGVDETVPEPDDPLTEGEPPKGQI